MTGISQPHIHNVLKGKKLFSLEVCDTILSELNFDLLDLLRPAEAQRQVIRVNLNLPGRNQVIAFAPGGRHNEMGGSVCGERKKRAAPGMHAYGILRKTSKL
jgi:hypothetical protein